MRRLFLGLSVVACLAAIAAGAIALAGDPPVPGENKVIAQCNVEVCGHGSPPKCPDFRCVILGNKFYLVELSDVENGMCIYEGPYHLVSAEFCAQYY